jgi:Htaa protein
VIPVTVTRLAGLTAAAVAAAVTVLPAPALAGGGTTSLQLTGPAAEALREQGVRISAVAPARGGAKRIVLPIGAGLAGQATTLLRQRGAIELRAPGGEKLRVGRLSLLLGKGARMEGTVGGEELDLFRVLRGGRREVDSVTGRVALGGLRLKLTGGAARLISKRLGLGELRPRHFATLAANVKGLTAGGPAPSAPGATQSASCPLPSTAGPAPEDPLPVKTPPPGAVNVTGATIDWHVRESFIRYIGGGEGTSVSDGATADGPVVLPGSSAALSYVFHFPFADGWLDPGANLASVADDAAVIGYSGAVRFLYSGHEIDLSTADPEIEIAGAASRAIFSISEEGGAAERQVLVNLDLSRAAAVTAGGGSYVYERVPGAIPSGTASSTFGGFYAPGTEFGCVTVRFSTG